MVQHGAHQGGRAGMTNIETRRDERRARLDVERARARKRVARAGLQTWAHMVDVAVKLERKGHADEEIMQLLPHHFGRVVRR